MNLEALYRKRSTRLGIRARLHHGTRRIFFILDRATRRFPGELGLWLQYVEFAKREKANGVLAKTFAAALKLHPSKPELWIYAARHAVDVNVDINEARSYMQRGLRFCGKSREMWREYAKLEMVFVAKVFLRRKVLGIDQPKKTTTEEDDEDDNMMKLPEITGEDFEAAKKDKSLDTTALENADTNPALNGALAIATFDGAMKAIPGDINFAADFYDLFAQFGSLNFCGRLLEYVVKYCLDVAPNNAKALWLGVQLPLRNVETSDPIFPGRLSAALAGMAAAVPGTDNKSELYLSFARHFTQLLKDSPELDEGIRKVITASLVKYYKQAEKEGETSPELYARWVEFMVLRGKKEEAVRTAQRGLERYPEHKGLSRLESGLKSSA
jgi:U3 small nucleolar RNA-associated protein 6